MLGSLAPDALADTELFKLLFANGKRLLAAYPEKRPLIVLTSRPPQLNTLFEVFNEGVILTNDIFLGIRYTHDR